MTLGQRIAVLNQGAIEQIAPPDELYNRPVSTFVAGFIGSPPMNLLEWGALPLDPAIERPSGATRLGIRPHDLTIYPADAPGLPATVDLVEPLGHAQVVRCRAAGERLVVVAPSEPRLEPGHAVALGIDPARVHAFDEQGRRR